MKNLKSFFGTLVLFMVFSLVLPINANAWYYEAGDNVIFTYSYFGKITNNETNETIYYKNSKTKVDVDETYDSSDAILQTSDDMNAWLEENDATIQAWGAEVKETSTDIITFNGEEYTIHGENDEEYAVFKEAVDNYLDEIGVPEDELEDYAVDVSIEYHYDLEVDYNIPKREVISEVKLSNISDDIIVGEKPKFNATLENNGKTVLLKYVAWTDAEYNAVYGLGNTDLNDIYGSNDSIDVFEEGKEYGLTLAIEIADPDKYVWADEVTIYIDGKEFKGESSKNDIYYLNYPLYIYIYEQPLPDVPIVNPEDETSDLETTIAKDVSKQLVKKSIGMPTSTKGISDELFNDVLDALNDDKELTITVESEKIKESDVSESIKTKVENELKNIKGYNVLGYYDINLVIKADGVALTDTVHNLSKDVEISLDIKDLVSTLPALGTNKVRNFVVIRIHNDEVDVLDATYDNGILTFKSDRFSDYIIAYDDIDVPNTLDNVTISFVVAIISLIGLATSTVYLTKKEIINN
ncbi:MAG: hypothetical protein IJ565_05260 [Bacilli bacterium]|nr:hypothetical protein [Bacilli bacterium]